MAEKMKRKKIIQELKLIRAHMADGTRCADMMDDLLGKLEPVSAAKGGGNGNGPPGGG